MAMSLKDFLVCVCLLCRLVPSWQGSAFNICIPRTGEAGGVWAAGVSGRRGVSSDGEWHRF